MSLCSLKFWLALNRKLFHAGPYTLDTKLNSVHHYSWKIFLEVEEIVSENAPHGQWILSKVVMVGLEVE